MSREDDLEQRLPGSYGVVRRCRDASWQSYKDFTLKFGRTREGTYLVEAEGPTGEAKTAFGSPLDGEGIETFLLMVGQREGAAIQGDMSERSQRAVDLGAQLYNAVLGGSVRGLYLRARQDAERQGYGLRVKLRLTDTPELADLPWEFLYDGHDFLALSLDTPVVRYLDLSRAPRPMRIELPLMVLSTISVPRDQHQLDGDTERARVQESLAVMEAQGLVEIRTLTGVTINTLQRTLRQAKQIGRPFHVWHHVGHGGFDPVTQSSMLILCDESGKSAPVGGFEIGTLFNSYPEIRLVLLNTCQGARASRQGPFAGVAAALVEHGIPAVIGMQFGITEWAASTFAEEFYAALVDGLPVDAATTEARRAVFFLPNRVEWGTPALYMRSPDGVLFDIGRTQDSGREYVTGDARDEAVGKTREGTGLSEISQFERSVLYVLVDAGRECPQGLLEKEIAGRLGLEGGSIRSTLSWLRQAGLVDSTKLTKEITLWSITKEGMRKA